MTPTTKALLAAVALIACLFPMVSAGPATWCGVNDYRQTIVINGSVDQPLVNYAMRLTVSNLSGTSNQSTIFLNGVKADDDWGDLHIYDNYCDEYAIFNGSSRADPMVIDLWVNIPALAKRAKSTDTTPYSEIYLYYGNTSTSTNTNNDGSETFPLFFDHFYTTKNPTSGYTTGDLTSRTWTATTTPTFYNSIAQVVGTASLRTFYTNINFNPNSSMIVRYKNYNWGNYTVAHPGPSEMISLQTTNYYQGINVNFGVPIHYNTNWFGTGCITAINATATTRNAPTPYSAPGIWHDLEIQNYALRIGMPINVFVDYSNQTTIYSRGYTSVNKIFFAVNKSTAAQIDIDYAFIRPLTPNEPTANATGTVEQRGFYSDPTPCPTGTPCGGGGACAMAGNKDYNISDAAFWGGAIFLGVIAVVILFARRD